MGRTHGWYVIRRSDGKCEKLSQLRSGRALGSGQLLDYLKFYKKLLSFSGKKIDPELYDLFPVNYFLKKQDLLK